MHIINRDNEELENHSHASRNYALQQFGNTYVSGIPPIVKTHGKCRKTLKTLILIGCLVGFICQTYYFLDLYWQYSTVSSVKRMKHISKPAITICDANLIRRKYFCEKKYSSCGEITKIVPDIDEHFSYALAACCIQGSNETYNRMQLKFKVNYEEEYFELNFTKEFGFSIEDSLVSCEWFYNKPSKSTPYRMWSRNCSKPQFMRGMNQEKLPAACYTLESAVGKWNYNPESLDYARSEITLKWEPSDHNDLEVDLPSSKTTPLRVYYLSFHSPGELSNPFFNGVSVQEGSEYKIRVSQVDHKRLHSPYSTHCLDYWKAWRKNGGRGPLRRDDCEKQCEIDETFSEYGCVPREITYPHEKPLCPDMKTYNLTLTIKIQECEENCHDACFDTSYIANSEIVGQLTLDEATKYGSSSVVRIEVDFNILKSIETAYKPKYESIELFSYIGGYLGMWLGWSLMAIFDFFEIGLLVIKNFLCYVKKFKIRSVKPIVLNS